MSERQYTQDALLVAHFMTRGQYDSEVGTWGYYTKSAFRKFLESVQITDVLREHLNSGVYHYVDELPTEVANALLAHGNDDVTTEAPQEPQSEPQQPEPEKEPEPEVENTEDTAEDTAEENAETAEATEEETSEEKPKARRSRRS
jgi:hypothetical protein